MRQQPPRRPRHAPLGLRPEALALEPRLHPAAAISLVGGLLTITATDPGLGHIINIEGTPQKDVLVVADGKQATFPAQDVWGIDVVAGAGSISVKNVAVASFSAAAALDVPTNARGASIDIANSTLGLVSILTGDGQDRLTFADDRVYVPIVYLRGGDDIVAMLITLYANGGTLNLGDGNDLATLSLNVADPSVPSLGELATPTQGLFPSPILSILGGGGKDDISLAVHVADGVVQPFSVVILGGDGDDILRLFVDGLKDARNAYFLIDGGRGVDLWAASQVVHVIGVEGMAPQ
jgi:hypothetical protein